MTKKLILPLFGFLVIILFVYFSYLITFPKTIEGFSKETEISISDFVHLLPTPAPYPVFKNQTPFPNLTAESIYVIDIDSMVPLYEKNADLPLLPASVTKIMTALVALENYSLDQVLTFDGTKIEGNGLGLQKAEQMTVENLLYGALVGSGNDAAYVLASNFPSGLDNFVQRMNQKAEELNLLNTHFVNPMGLDQEGQYSTARDLAMLSITALKNPEFTRIVATPSLVFTDFTGSKVYNIKNTNELILEGNGFTGIKTGWTENAGECLVALYNKDSRRVITVVLHSQNRKEETKQISGWFLENFVWEKITPQISYR
jgi:D-alanyl-D-alanine carboxypeptidase (penicillin-binding protein 5/6)